METGSKRKNRRNARIQKILLKGRTFLWTGENFFFWGGGAFGLIYSSKVKYL
jgi:hypothetical protein